jgi:uncharacterized protein YndB with AHSA1/START domain
MSDLHGVLRHEGAADAVTFEREYGTGVDDLWDALVHPDRLARWFAPVSGDLRLGGTVEVGFDDAPAHFVVEACEAPTTLRVRWLHVDRHSVVRARLEPVSQSLTRLTLVHERLTTSAPEYAAGWHWYLDSLSEHTGRATDPRPDWDALAEHYRAAQAAGRE